MEVVVYFPILVGAGPEGTLRQIQARLEAAGSGRAEIFQSPSSEAEKIELQQAIDAVRTWERLDPARGAGAAASVTLGVSGDHASEEGSSRLAGAAADWAARRLGSLGPPRGLLVATGCLTSAQRATATGQLAVEPVAGVAAKAGLVQRALGPDGMLRLATDPGGRFEGRPVLFAFPRAALGEPGTEAALAALRERGVTPLPLDRFQDLLSHWLPAPAPAVAAPAGSTTAGPAPSGPAPSPLVDAPAPRPGLDSRPPAPRGRRMARATVGAALLAAASASAAALVLAPERLEAAAAWAVLPSALREGVEAVARDPDAPATGCRALEKAAAGQPLGTGPGWTRARQRVEGCEALWVCDRDAGSPLDSARLARGQGGLFLPDLARRRDVLAAARAACARAAEAFPDLARAPYQLGRALAAGGEPELLEAARQARARAVAMGHALALAETLEGEAVTSPAPGTAAAVRDRFRAITARPDAPPEVLLAFGRLLACGLLRLPAERVGPVPAGEAGEAVSLLARAASAPAAAHLPQDAARQLRSTLEMATRARDAGGMPPAACANVARAAG